MRGFTDYQVLRLESCIAEMENACAEARLRLKESTSALVAAEEILHTFAWGWANASTGLSTALRAVQRELDRSEATRTQEEKKESDTDDRIE